MSDNSKIEWTDASWNPIRAIDLKTGKVGWHCEHTTTGCEFCYAEGINKRLGTGLPFKPGHRERLNIALDEKTLLAPLRWKKPRMIFVCSMTDVFADFVTDEMLDKMFAIMALCPQHTFQVLTKRAKRMREWVSEEARDHCVDCEMEKIAPDHWCAREVQDFGGWPLKNVWLGVSCERQQEADERIPLLLQTPAAVKFISAEPLLGPIDLSRCGSHYTGSGPLHLWRAGGDGQWRKQFMEPPPEIDWVIVGGESGPRARPMMIQWARDIRDQCTAAGVAFFFKQWGEHTPDDPAANRTAMRRVGKKAAGRLLDGVEHNGMPA